MTGRALPGILAGLILLTGAPAGAGERKPWHTVTGPENLDQAVRNAWGYQQPEYEEPLRFDRTTHISFPLPALPGSAMSEHTIEGSITRDDINTDGLHGGDLEIVVPLKLPQATPGERASGATAPAHSSTAPQAPQTLRAISQIR